MTTQNEIQKIKEAVEEFFGAESVVYATPGTDNYNSNFYGDSHICALDRDDVEGCITTAFENWTFSDDEENDPELDRLQLSIDSVLDDLQFDMPED